MICKFCHVTIKKMHQTTPFYATEKSTFSFSYHLQIFKKINNAKEDPSRKTGSNFDFSQVA